MLNKLLMPAVRGPGMSTELLLATFLICVGLCTAGAGTHLYQMVFGQQAMLRFDGKTYAGTLGHLFMSFICGPYIMLQMGWQHEDDSTLSMSNALIAALVAFGWAFLTGLLIVGCYVAVLRL